MLQNPSKGFATYPGRDTRSCLLYTIFAEQAERERAANLFSFHECSGLLEKGVGGAERNRTADPLLAKQVLYQLSYSPITPSSPQGPSKTGGPGKTRTSDLTLIKRAL
jgi:hypothetical protein